MDIKLIQDEFGAYTIGFANGDFVLTDGLDSALTVSLLSDARASSDQVAAPENRRSWLGDINNVIKDRIFGSLLWLVNQKKLTTDTLNEAINFAQLSLKWMLDDSIAQSIKVSGEIVPRSGIKLLIEIKPKVGETVNHYLELWENT